MRSNYITPEGDKALRAELEQLVRFERPEVTQAVSEAAAMGDRSENAEYIYGKKRLREIDRRIRFLIKRLEVLRVVHPSKEQEGKIFFGAFVEVERDDGVVKTFQIVGPDEIDTQGAKISIDSPMARALLKKQVDDEVDVDSPNGKLFYTITHIHYNIRD